MGINRCGAADEQNISNISDISENEPFSVPSYEVPARDDGHSPKNTGLAIAPQNDGAKNSMGQFIGANHINVPYSLSGENCLIDGARRLRSLGSSTIKVYLELYYQNRYTANMNWGEGIESAIDLAREECFAELFGMDFDTFVLGAYIWGDAWGNPATYCAVQCPAEARGKEYRDRYELTYYLCKTYAGTGKTFILQNWEGDWASRTNHPDYTAADAYLTPDAARRMIEWANTRQDAVMAARRDAGCEGVNVYHALEVNLIQIGIEGKPCVTSDVIPRTYCDFYAYSAYDTLMMTPEAYADALDYLREKANSNRTGGKSGLYIGEAGYPEAIYGAKEVQSRLSPSIDIAREKGYAHYLYWSIYDEPPAMGYWLLKPDGERGVMWNELYKRLNGGRDDPLYLADLEKSKAAWPLTFGYGENGTAQKNGIEPKPLWLDGEFEVVSKDGVWCIVTNIESDPAQTNIYFNADDGALEFAEGSLDITVTYFDGGKGLFGICYLTDGLAVNEASAHLTGTDEWKSHTFAIPDIASLVKFHGGFADFRIYGTSGPIYVSGVEVSRP
jgi:hypothetical protein